MAPAMTYEATTYAKQREHAEQLVEGLIQAYWDYEQAGPNYAQQKLDEYKAWKNTVIEALTRRAR